MSNDSKTNVKPISLSIVHKNFNEEGYLSLMITPTIPERILLHLYLSDKAFQPDDRIGPESGYAMSSYFFHKYATWKEWQSKKPDNLKDKTSFSYPLVIHTTMLEVDPSLVLDILDKYLQYIKHELIRPSYDATTEMRKAYTDWKTNHPLLYKKLQKLTIQDFEFVSQDTVEK